jgi:beta-lactamase regulating signal transducer with metallopeptidase domain
MTLTVLAVVFLLLILVVVFVGQRFLSQKTESLKATNQEQCAVCRNTYEKSQLVERQIGDYKILYFCKQCIEGLYTDLKTII